MFPRWRERAVVYFTQGLVSAYEEAERRADAIISQRIELHLADGQPEAAVLPGTSPPTVASQTRHTLPALPPVPPLPPANVGEGSDHPPALPPARGRGRPRKEPPQS